MKCHKDLTQECAGKDCPMWFESPNVEGEGDCAECLNAKQSFWDTIKTISDKMKDEETSKADDIEQHR